VPPSPIFPSRIVDAPEIMFFLASWFQIKGKRSKKWLYWYLSWFTKLIYCYSNFTLCLSNYFQGPCSLT